MFKKRQKKVYPPGTFIPMPARVCAIIQLCIAFTVLIWNLSEPFAGELFTYKSELLLYQDVMGIPSHAAISEERLNRLNHNANLFKQLPTSERELITAGFNRVQSNMQRSFVEKLERAFHIVAFEVPPFELAWLVLSFIIPIMLLKRVEGAVQAVWLLPLLAALFALDNRIYAPTKKNGEVHLYPTEQTLVENFLKEPLNDNIFEQQAQLMRAWKLYLIETWAHEIPSQNPETFNVQAEKGEFNFNIMRLKHQIATKQTTNTASTHRDMNPQESLLFLALYLFWNTYFAYTIWRHRHGITRT